jgi:hypothetical protein
MALLWFLQLFHGIELFWIHGVIGGFRSRHRTAYMLLRRAVPVLTAVTDV